MPKINFKCAKCGTLLQGDVKLRDSIRCPECKSNLVITKVPSVNLTTRIKDIIQSPSFSENVFVALFLLGFALLLFAGYKANKENAEAEPLRNELRRQASAIVQNLVSLPATKQVGCSLTTSLRIKGKAIVWDQEEDNYAVTQGRLRTDLQSTFTAGGNATVFIQMRPEFEKIGVYSISGSVALRRTTRIIAYIWPKQEIVACKLFVDDPPEKRNVDRTYVEPGDRKVKPFYDPTAAIAAWIESLPIEQ